MAEPVDHPANTGSHWRRVRRSLWAMAAFGLGFAALIALLANYYLLPAAEAARTADASGRRQLSAFSMLLLAIVLLSLLIGLAMTFRIHRFFFPRPQPKRMSTDYVDAWRESARRVHVEADDSDANDADDGDDDAHGDDADERDPDDDDEPDDFRQPA